MIEFQDAIVVKTKDKVLKCDRCGRELFRIKGELPGDDPEFDKKLMEWHEESLLEEEHKHTLYMNYTNLGYYGFNVPINKHYVFCKSCMTRVLNFIDKKEKR